MIDKIILSQFALGGYAGFLAGWLIFQRPQWVTDLFNKLWTKLFG
jgi:hypothetical protein